MLASARQPLRSVRLPTHPGPAVEVPLPLRIFSGPCPQPQQGADGRRHKEKAIIHSPMETAPPGKHVGKPAQGSLRCCCQLPTGSVAKPKPKVSGLRMPQPGNYPVPQISRHGDRLKSLQPLDVGTRSSSAATGPGDAPSWDAHPAIHNSCSRSSRPASMPMCPPGSLPTHRLLDRLSAARQ